MKNIFLLLILFLESCMPMRKVAASNENKCFSDSGPRKMIRNSLGKQNSAQGFDAALSVNWAEVANDYNSEISTILPRLKEIKYFKNLETQNVNARPEKKDGYWFAQTVEINMTVALFITLEWTEEWRIEIQKGSAEKPQTVLMTYQKVSGTSHLERFCGSMKLESQGKRTRIHYAEEVRSSHRSPEEVRDGLLDTLNKITK